jgi:hypothetical protein
MDPETHLGHQYLEQWAKEAHESLSGYASTTLLGRIMEQGPGAGQTGIEDVRSVREDRCVRG